MTDTPSRGSTLRIHDLMQLAVQQVASDIHIAAGERPVLRVDGEIRRLEVDPLLPDEAKRLAYSVMNEKQKTIFETDMEIDFSIGIKGLCRFRVNVFTQSRGVGMVMRQIPTRVQTIEELKLPQIFFHIARFRRGIVLVTGPTGSGKSTTLAALIDVINAERAEHILTIEDPIEFVHAPRRCIINQREVGTHTGGFAAALRSALREDPDVILVGELRDLETVSLALTAAETGHLVFGTLHTNSAPETIDRLIDAYPAAQQSQIRTMISTSLQAVVSQALLRGAQGGRVPAFEIMIVTPAIRNLIRENKLYQIPSILQTGQARGMQTMEVAVRDLALKGVITRQTAIEALNKPDLFDEPGVAGKPGRPPAAGGGR
jgi:twitching motility protein PilT